MVEIIVLGSGSAGNCTLIRTPSGSVLIDAGLSAKKIATRLAEAGSAPEDISGIMLTHEHGDHTSGLRVFCAKYRVPVFCNPLTADAVRHQSKELAIAWNYFATGASFEVGGLTVSSFSVPHDAADPVGFVLRHPLGSVGVATDIGFATQAVASHLAGVQAVLLEANYDEALLENDQKRPWSTKQRIMSRHGHLSNRAAAELAANFAHPGLETMILGHLSEDCNETGLVESTFRDVFASRNLPLPRMICASRQSITPPVRLGSLQPA